MLSAVAHLKYLAGGKPDAGLAAAAVTDRVEALLAQGARVRPLRPDADAREAVGVGARGREHVARSPPQQEALIVHSLQTDSSTEKKNEKSRP